MRTALTLLLNLIFFLSVGQTVSNQGLIISLPFSGNSLDQSGNGKHGSVYGAQLTADRFGNPNNAYEFDGVNDYIKVFNDSLLNFGVNDDYTISCWVKPDSIQNSNFQTGDIISKWIDNPGSGTNEGYPYVLRFYSQTNPNHGKVFFGRYDKTCQNFPASNSTNSFLSENFIHLVTLKRDSVLELYVNGVLEKSIIDNSSCETQNNDDFFIGRRGGSVNAAYFKGKIDDINIYDSALDSLEILSLFQAPNPVTNNCNSPISNTDLEICFPFTGNAFDQSGNNNHGAVFGAQLTTDRFGNPNSAYEFDGVDDYIEIQTVSDLDSIGDFTISVWYYQHQWQPQTGGSNKDRQYVFDAHSYSSTVTNNFFTDGPLICPILDYSNNSFLRHSVFENSSNNYPFDLAFNDTSLLNSWIHTVFVRKGDSTYHYYNSKLEGEITSSANLIDIKHNMFIGTFSGNNPNYGGKNFNFDGKIDDFLIYSRALDSNEVKVLFTGSNCSAKTVSSQTSICPSDSTLTPKGFYTSSPGFYHDTLLTSQGCDSIISLEVTLNQVSQSNISPIVCEQYSLPSGKGLITASGQYLDTLSSILGCDSILQIDLTVTGNFNLTKQSGTICSGGVYQLPSGIFVGSPGVYSDTIPSSIGCDSIVETTITSGISYYDRSSANICQGDVFTAPSGKTFNTSQNILDTLPTVNGCDSVFEIFLTVHPMPTNVNIHPADTTICAGDFVTLNVGSYAGYQWSNASTQSSIMVSSAGIYTVTVSNSGNCQASSSTTVSITTDPSLCGSVGLEETESNRLLNIYPNPTQNEAFISLKNFPDGINLKLVDLKGVEYQNLNIEVTNNQPILLELNGIASGVYFIRIQDEIGVTMKRLVVR